MLTSHAESKAHYARWVNWESISDTKSSGPKNGPPVSAVTADQYHHWACLTSRIGKNLNHQAISF